MSEEDQNLPYLYWTRKLHKSPYEHRFIAGSIKCTTKDLSCLLNKVLSAIKDGLVKYCNNKTSRNGVNNMWILSNSTSLLSSLDQLDVRTATSVQTFEFSTLCTSILHDLLKSRISNLAHNAFRKKDGNVDIPMCTFQIFWELQGWKTSHLLPSLPPPLIFKAKFQILSLYQPENQI